MSLYSYEKSPVNAALLKEEIEQSAIVTALDHIDFTAPNVLEIYFKAELSGGDITVLDGLVDVHDGEAESAEDTLVKDADGALMARNKTTTAGYSIQLRAIGFVTSTVSSVENKDDNEVDYGDAAVKFYDIAGNELTTQEQCNTECVKTVFTVNPNFTYEIVGGQFSRIQEPTGKFIVYIIGAYPIPAIYGGSKYFTTNLDMRFSKVRRLDGRSVKRLPTDAGINRLKVVVKHQAGEKVDCQLELEHYRA